MFKLRWPKPGTSVGTLKCKRVLNNISGKPFSKMLIKFWKSFNHPGKVAPLKNVCSNCSNIDTWSCFSNVKNLSSAQNFEQNDVFRNHIVIYFLILVGKTISFLNQFVLFKFFVQNWILKKYIYFFRNIILNDSFLWLSDNTNRI